jgi:hypothetical protein
VSGVDGMPAGLSAALVDRYTIERELGQGGMATVYIAEDLKHLPIPINVITLLTDGARPPRRATHCRGRRST